MEDEDEIILKFDDCLNCRFRYRPELYCKNDCDYGESYEPDDIDEVDVNFGGRI